MEKGKEKMIKDNRKEVGEKKEQRLGGMEDRNWEKGRGKMKIR